MGWELRRGKDRKEKNENQSSRKPVFYEFPSFPASLATDLSFLTGGSTPARRRNG